MFRFETPQDLDRWHVSTDAYFGGRSRASLRLGGGGGGGAEGAVSEEQQQQQPTATTFATFSGQCSTAPTLAQAQALKRAKQVKQQQQADQAAAAKPDQASSTAAKSGSSGAQKSRSQLSHTSSNAEISRAGYAVAASKVFDLADPFDLSSYSHLVYTVRGDGGRYLASLRTDSVGGGGGDVWQAPFSAPRGQWADVRVPLGAFALTHRGKLVERRLPLRADRVLSLGLSFAAAAQDEAFVESGRREGGGEATTAATTAGNGGLAFRLDLKEIRAEAADDDGL